MEKAEGIVVQSNGNISKVKIVRSSMCGENCGSCNLCGNRETFVFAENAAEAQENDRVLLEMDSSSGLKAAALVYGMPLLILIAGIVLISILQFNQVKGLLWILALIVLYFLLLKVKDKNMKPTAKITEVYKNDSK